MNKTARKTITMFLLVLLAFPLASQSIPIITVLDFKTNNISASDMRSIISLLSSALFKTGRFRVIDVTQRDTLLQELEFSMSGCTDESCQLKIGKMLSAEQIIVGDIAKVGSRYMLSSKMLQTETAGTLASADGIYPTMDALVDDLYTIASTLAGTGVQKAAASAAQGPATPAAQPYPPLATQLPLGTLRIALLAPLTGSVPTFGVSTRDGALLAIEEWNAKGGVLGMKITPIVEDGQCTPAPALNAARKVIEQDKVHYIVGEVCSAASIPVSVYTNSKKVIQISPISTNTAVTVDSTGKTKEYVFRACFIDPFQGLVGANFAIQMGAKKAFLMIDRTNGYVRGLSEAFEKSFTEKGGKIVGKENYTASDKDFSAILAKVKQTKPDVVYLPDYYQIVNLATKQAKAEGITVPFMGGDGWDSSDLDLKAADGGYFTNHYSPDDTRNEVVTFRAAYGAAFKDDKGEAKVPDALAALAYDATNILIQAIKDAGADDTAKVKVALEQIRFRGVTGQMSFDGKHNPVKSAVILTVKDGKVRFKATVAP
jgi:branched-chain amino acid transport system substrate-binding protein